MSKHFKPSDGTTATMAALQPGIVVQPTVLNLAPLGDDDVEIRITHSGVCHSDLHTIKGEWGPQSGAVVPGHEILGHVTAKGKNVSKFALGDRVGVGPQAFSCGSCKTCGAGVTTYCQKGFVGTYGSTLPTQDPSFKTIGGYAHYNRTDQRFVFPIPANLDGAATAPLLCAGVTVFTPLRRADVKKGDKVAIVGLGGLGHIAVKFAAAMGAEVTVISTSASKEADAKALGATNFLLSNSADFFTANARTFDTLLNTTSASMDYAQWFALVKPYGNYVMLGAAPTEMKLSSMAFIFTGVKIWGSLIGSPKDFEEMLALCAEKNIGCQVETFAFADANKAIESCDQNKMKYRCVLVMPDEQ
jgi:uncharacterized zinc-type alcohol dehydrogenase-like protein